MTKTKHFANRTRAFFQAQPHYIELVPQLLEDHPEWIAIVRSRLQGISFGKIAVDYQISRMRIHQIETLALDKLQSFIHLS